MNNKYLNQISKSQWYHPKFPNKPKTILIMPDDEIEDYVFRLSQISQFVEDVIKSNGLGFEFSTVKGSLNCVSDKVVAIPLKLANKHYEYSHAWYNLMAYGLAEDYLYSPAVSLFQEAFVSSGVLFDYGNIDLTDRFYKQKLFNSLIVEIRNLWQSGTYRKQMARHAEKMNLNHKKIVTYIDNLFQHHSRLLVLRFDLGYGTSYAKKVDFELAAQHRDLFLKRIADDNKVNSKIKGYAWKMEFGEHRGFHFHFVMFMDGSKVQSDSRWCKRFICLWKHVVAPEFQKLKMDWRLKHADNPAWGWNCNSTMNKKKFVATGTLGIGMIQRNDDEKIKALKQNVVKYFFKTDQYIIAKPIGNHKGRTYSRGQLIRKKKGNGEILSSKNKDRSLVLAA